MKSTRNYLVRILCLALSAVMIITCMFGCADKQGADSQADSAAIELPAAVFSVDVPCVAAPDEGAEVTQTLKLTSSAPIEGSLKAEDITLGGSFGNMKVSDVSNDAETITLTVSGVPTFDGATTLGYVGTMEIVGSYFGAEKPVKASVPVMCKSGGSAASAYFYPYFDSLVDNETSKELHILLRPYLGDFTKLANDSFTFGGVLEGAEIVSLKKSGDDYELVLNVPVDPEADNGRIYGTITLAAGSMTNNEEEVSYTRDFSAGTVGRADGEKFTQAQLDQIKNIVHPKKEPSLIDATFPEIGNLYNIGKSCYGYYGTAMTAYKTIYSMLGAFGIVEIKPSEEEQRHQEIMEALGTISGQIKDMQEDVTAIRKYAVANKRLLENLSQMEAEDYLAQFHSHFDAMVKYTDEIIDALRVNTPQIIALAEAHYVEGEEGREMKDYETDAILREFGKEIVMMDQSNYNTIATKLQLLESEYTTAMTYMKNKNSNPISRYCEVYRYVDNFSTISIVDKQAYALDLDCQFDRTLSYLILLGGIDSQTQNINLFANAYFPDVVAEATNANGDPYCYLMDSYVRIESDPANNLWLPMKNGSDTYTVLESEDFAKFVSRMKGRTMSEELELAGFDRSVFANQLSNFSSSDLCSRCGNNKIKGLAFEFKRIQADTKGVPAYGNKGDAKNWKNLASYVDTQYGIGSTAAYYRYDLTNIFYSVKDPSKSFIIIADGMYYDKGGMYEQGTRKNYACTGYLNKASDNSMTNAPKGWYDFEMMTYLVPVAG